jgi:predicted CopG family antitoxin
VKAKSKKRVTVSISRETKEVLDSIKHTGQSYDGLIRELVLFRKKEAEFAK